MIEERAKTNTIVKRIKKMLFNYDLAVAYVKGEIKIREANMRLYKGDTKKISKNDKILKIEFWFSRTKLSAGLRMLIQTRHETENYSFYCSKEEAKEFIIELKKLNIKVELDEYFANLLEK